MKKYTVTNIDDRSQTELHANSWEEAKEKAVQWILGGDWGQADRLIGVRLEDEAYDEFFEVQWHLNENIRSFY